MSQVSRPKTFANVEKKKKVIDTSSSSDDIDASESSSASNHALDFFAVCVAVAAPASPAVAVDAAVLLGTTLYNFTYFVTRHSGNSKQV
jgi:hypothetical protein